MRRERIVWIVLATLLLVLVAYLDWRLTQAPQATGPVMNFGLPLPAPTASVDDSNPTWPAISSDGQQLAFVGNSADGSSGLWVRRLDEANARQLAGTQNARLPFWSPDGQFVAFFADGKLKKIPVSGGQSQIICDSKNAMGGTWNQENLIVFAAGKPPAFLQVSANGGVATEIERWHEDYRLSYPRFLPASQQYLFSVASSIAPNLGGWYVSGSQVEPRKKLLDNALSVQYVPQGYMLILKSDGRLVAQKFDLRTLHLYGSSKFLAEGIAGFSASDNGVIAYRTARPPTTIGVFVNWLSLP